MTEKLKFVQGSGNAFIDPGFDKVKAKNRQLRSDLMMCIEEFCRTTGKSRAATAKALQLTQPRLNALLKGRLSRFNLDALVKIASRAGMKVRLVIEKAA